MSKNYNLISDVPFEVITGLIDYNLTNDYMFKATMQECEEARVGLISALLGIDPAQIIAEVTNPIELGKSIASKDFYLDVMVSVNNIKMMNLEMQVTKLNYWDKRTLSYCCRSYDQLCSGGKYEDLLPFQQVGFTKFDMFEDNNRFYDTFCMTSRDSAQIYTDNFLLSVVNLKRIDEATEQDKQYRLDKWCRLITVSTWEELKEIAKEDPYMQATAKNLYMLSSDFEIREEARRREEYYTYVHSLEEKIAEKDNALAEKDAKMASALAEKDSRIAELERQLRSLN